MALAGQYHPPGFAAWCHPNWVVISGGHSRNSPEVREAYQAVEAKVLHTASDGAVTVVVSEAGVTVETFRGAGPESR